MLMHIEAFVLVEVVEQLFWVTTAKSRHWQQYQSCLLLCMFFLQATVWSRWWVDLNYVSGLCSSTLQYVAEESVLKHMKRRMHLLYEGLLAVLTCAASVRLQGVGDY